MIMNCRDAYVVACRILRTKGRVLSGRVPAGRVSHGGLAAVDGMVRTAGVEPARLAAQDFKSRASTGFATSATVVRGSPVAVGAQEAGWRLYSAGQLAPKRAGGISGYCLLHGNSANAFILSTRYWRNW